MNTRHKLILSLSLLAATATVAGLWMARNAKNADDSSNYSDKIATREEGGRTIQVGANVQQETGLPKIEAGKPAPVSDPKERHAPSYGTLPAIKADATIQTKLAYEAAKNGTFPYRVSVAVMPPAFDPKKWAQDAAYKKNYLDEPAPARCYQSAQPGKEVPKIAAAGPTYITTKQNEPVELRVKAEPGMPCTFTSFDAAAFKDSQLTTQTVVADDQGIAVATLVASSGVIDDCRVLVACPAASGQIHMTVHVNVPGFQPQKPASELTDADAPLPIPSVNTLPSK